MKHSPTAVSSALSECNIPFTIAMAERAAFFLDQVYNMARPLGLVSPNDADKLLPRHFLDSLAPLLHLSVPLSAKILDLGSGGGFPSIPMKILRPDLELTLFESTEKKSLFLKQISAQLRFHQFTVKNQYLTHKEKECVGFDFCFARASVTLIQFARICSFRLLPQGKLCTFKHTKSFASEAARFDNSKMARIMKLCDPIEYTLRGTQGSFVLVTLERADVESHSAKPTIASID